MLCHTARKRASQNLKSALPDSLLAVQPGASSLDTLFLHSLPTAPRVLGKSLSSNSFTDVNGSSYLPLPPTPKQKQEKKNPLSPPCLPLTPQCTCFLSLSSKAAGRGCSHSAISAALHPHLAPHTPCLCLHPSTLEGLQIRLSSQNVQHNLLLLNSLTFENVQC